MRLWPGAIGVLLLLALLTWLLLRAIDTSASTHAVTLQALDDFALAQASLHRDVLQARAGLLRDYDVLAKAVQAMEDAVDRLRSRARAEALDPEAVDRLAATAAEQEDLTERFKSNNALLQNSLSYVGLLSTSGLFGAQDAQLAPATGALAAATLHLTLDSSQEAVAALQERIDAFAARAPAVGPDADAAQALVAHARLLHDLLPVVDETLKALVAVPSSPPLEDVRALFANRRAAVEATARRFQVLLYMVSLLLLVILVRLGLRLRARALALRQRAAFEHVIAENSTRLINCPPSETDSRLKQVLGDLCRAMGAERGYVVLDESPTRTNSWCAEGAAYPPGWPDQALALSTQLGAAGPDIVIVPNVAALPRGAVKDALAAAGVSAWACVPLLRPGRVRGILGFDALHSWQLKPAWDGAFPLPVVRLAGDAVANAIEREFLERDRTRLATRLERARRMQMVGSLASGIAHNFNNIIGAILGYSEMVEPQLAPGSKPAQHVDEIRRAAERGRDLIDRILTFGRRRAGRVQPIQVRALFEESGSLLRAALPAGVELAIADVAADIAVSGEPAQLQQVILNLCANAAQAMEGHGRVQLTAGQKGVVSRLLLSHGELSPGRYVWLAVDDTGPGFDEAVARRLFEPFFTTRVAGTGLGLATVREIVRDHDGAMNVQSKPGHGSRFEVWLPPAAADGGLDIGPAVPLGRGETVLVVESEREQRLSDEEMLAALGYEPVGFERPADAIAACRSAPDRFDVILVSQALQSSGGLDWARALHQATPRQPIVLATASADVSADVLAETGIVEVLRRPLASAELAAALARCLRQNAKLQS
jgi:signal transduction histidine kinase/ActR/RegA family two-component response regulator